MAHKKAVRREDGQPAINPKTKPNRLLLLL